MQEVNEPINPSITTARYIPWGLDESVQNVKEFKSNAVSTAKYDPYFITFIPRFLFEMFTRVAYLYFLIQVRMDWTKHGHDQMSLQTQVLNWFASSCAGRSDQHDLALLKSVCLSREHVCSAECAARAVGFFHLTL